MVVSSIFFFSSLIVFDVICAIGSRPLKNYIDVLNYFKGREPIAHITSKTIREEKKKMLETTIFYWYRYILKNNIPVSLENFDQIFFDYYKDEPYFEEAKAVFERIRQEVGYQQNL